MLPAMMRSTRALLLTFLLVTSTAACGRAAETTARTRDPLAAEVDRWSSFLQGEAAAGPAWTEVKPAALSGLDRARQALGNGRRLLALVRLAEVRESLATTAYLSNRPAALRNDMAGFEAEWTRMGGELREPVAASSLDGVRPALARALGETALLQVRGYYEASLDYGRNTTPAAGLYYLGNAQAQRELVDFLRTISEPSPGRAPALRSFRPELEALEADLLAAYRPPASISQHGEFIVTSSMLKEARELDAAGLHHGALLRYLQAAQRIAALRPPAAVPAGAKQDWEERLSADGVDHSLGRLFLELSEDNPARAHILLGDVLPRYFAALQPAPPGPPRPEPRVTVTLVRWPYT